MTLRLRVGGYVRGRAVVCCTGAADVLADARTAGLFPFFLTSNKVGVDIFVLPLARYVPSFGGYI